MCSMRERCVRDKRCSGPERSITSIRVTASCPGVVTACNTQYCTEVYDSMGKIHSVCCGSARVCSVAGLGLEGTWAAHDLKGLALSHMAIMCMA